MCLPVSSHTGLRASENSPLCVFPLTVCVVILLEWRDNLSWNALSILGTDIYICDPWPLILGSAESSGKRLSKAREECRLTAELWPHPGPAPLPRFLKSGSHL